MDLLDSNYGSIPERNNPIKPHSHMSYGFLRPQDFERLTVSEPYETTKIKRSFGRDEFQLFFFFSSARVSAGGQKLPFTLCGYYSHTISYCSCTVHPLFSHFFIKNGSHDIIHIFKNYFATVFSVFSF